MAFTPSPSFVSVAPGNPSAIASATYQMCGLGVAGATAFAITPLVTGRLLVVVTGDLVENATAQTATVQLSYGTNTAPANAAAVTGTQIGGQVNWTSLTGQLTIPFSLVTIITGLAIPSISVSDITTAATPVWLDVAAKSSAGTVQLQNLTCMAIEL